MNDHPFELIVSEVAIMGTVMAVHRSRCLRCALPFVKCTDFLQLNARFALALERIEEHIPDWTAKAAALEAQTVGRKETRH